MSYADDIFKLRCKEILEEGNTDKNGKVRPHWKDGTPAYTYRKFGVVNEYDLEKSFPIMTLRRTAVKSAVEEILWIYQKKSNVVSELNSHIWDSWKGEDGTIGKAYGYQIGKKSKYKDGEYDQMDRVLMDIKENPTSRRIMTNMYCIEDLHEMNLYPCAYSTTWSVINGRLNLMLNQRSQDMLTASNWNVVQYAVLLMMVAQVNNLIPGKLLHVISDCHIYDRHVEIVEELLKKPGYDVPKVLLNPHVHDFYDFTPDDIIVNNYKYHPFDYEIEVAI